MPIASPPPPPEANVDALYMARGDIFANETKSVRELTSARATLRLWVREDGETADAAKLAPGDGVEVGPFAGGGMDLRGPVAGAYAGPTLVLFVAGAGAATATALLEADPDAGGLVLELRRDVVVYYSAPNDRAVAFRERFARWAAAPARARVVVSTRDTFAEMFDNDDALAYEPAATAAIVLTGGDEEAEAAALDACADAEIAIIVRDSQPAEPPVITDTTAM